MSDNATIITIWLSACITVVISIALIDFFFGH